MTMTTAPTQAPSPAEAIAAPPTPVPALDVVVPVFNEEAGLESCLRRLHAHLAAEFPYRFRITVADNASTDGTLAVISRCYNLILRGTLAARFSDAQCGFKAIRADVAAGLLPLIEDNGWFFDTELLVLAERSGLRIHEVPVDWVDDPDSRVDLVTPSVGPALAGAGGPGGGGPGGGSSSPALTSLLRSTTTTWAAAAIGSQSATGLQLSSGKAVISIGGFTGSDPAPTLAQFQQYVAAGQIAYFVAGGGFGGGFGGGGSSAASQISAWVQANFTATTVGGTTVYELTG